MKPRFPSLRALLLFFAAVFANRTGRCEAPIDYLRDVKPILREKCYACHGALKQESGLRLDTLEFIRRGGESGAAIIGGQADKSLLVQRITASDEAERMPIQATPLSQEQIAKITSWLQQGAQGPAQEDPERDPRDHWSFRTPQRPRLPAVDDATWSRNPIDVFVAAEHAKHGLRPRPVADRSTLLRRLYLDLIGLPPTADELRSFIADPSPDAYERVVERLLNSPRHGERWGRHWMDVWRYADWYGRRNVPDVWNSAPQIWRWRDWIVRSLNEDKGYDRMVSEMLAGDEITPDDDEIAVATGYLVRNWYALNPNDWMRQNVEHTSKAFLGLTFSCAHCHDHKYDPITQRDYFALRACFEPIGIRQDQVAGEPDPGPFQEYSYSVLRKIVRVGAVRIYDKTPEAPTWLYTGGDERNRVKEYGSIAPSMPAIFGGKFEIRPVELPAASYYPGLRASIQQTAVKERRVAIEKLEAALLAARSAATSALVELRQRWEKDPESYTARRAVEAVELGVLAIESKLVAERSKLDSLQARVTADLAKYGISEASRVEELSRAARDSEKRSAVLVAEAAVLDGMRQLADVEKTESPANDAQRVKDLAAASKQVADAYTELAHSRKALADTTKPTEYTPLSRSYSRTSTGRRRALAEWITSSRNPLTARVAVNHIWMRHFHKPLVESVFDFGRNGSPPSHPELIDWLAVEFMESGWSMRHLHRLIVTSQTYRLQSSQGDFAENAARDPSNRLLWRQNVGRLEAEVIRDSLLACANRIDLQVGGQELENSDALTTRRRSLYYSSQPELDGKSEFSAMFDAPDAMDCYRRSRSIIPQQALAMSNSTLAHEVSASVADQIWLASPPGQRSPQNFVRQAFEQILSRDAAADELNVCVGFLERQAAARNKSFVDDPESRSALVRVLLNHNDFVAVR